MATTRRESLPLKTGADVVMVRQAVRSWAAELGFTLVDQTKIVTAASELARNTVDYGKGGEVILEAISLPPKKGLKLTFEDNGPGIPNIELALRDGYTTGTGLGLGLSGAKRLSHDFELHSEVGKGTRVIITRWT